MACLVDVIFSVQCSLLGCDLCVKFAGLVLVDCTQDEEFVVGCSHYVDTLLLLLLPSLSWRLITLTVSLSN